MITAFSLVALTRRQLADMRLLKVWLLLLCFGLGWSEANALQPSASSGPHRLEVERVKIVTFNVANLFDTRDDRGRTDETWLPKERKNSQAHAKGCQAQRTKAYREECLKLDWDQQALAAKLDGLAAVIRLAQADVVLLQEVENRAVLDELNSQLPTLAYRAILLEGQDRRGIDQAVLTSLPVLSQPELLYADCPGSNCAAFGGRGVLSVSVALPIHRHSSGQQRGGGVLRLLNVHLPSPAAPASRRLKAVQKLHSLAQAIQDSGELVVLAGDFNITSEEKTSSDPIGHTFGRHWKALEDLQCPSCRGTYYYGPTRSWSWLDKLIMPTAVASRHDDNPHNWEVAPNSLEILRLYPQQTTRGGYPRKFRASSKWGVSDHFPVSVVLQAR